MYFSHSFVLAILPFFTAAIPLAVSPASRGIAIPIAKRANSTLVDPSVIASQVQNSIAKIQMGMAAFQRNTGQPHPLAGGIKTSSKRATGGVSLTDASNFLWYGSIKIGTPAVTFTVDFDTGSSDLFVPSTSCGSSCDGHQRYNPSESATAQDRGSSFTLTYGDGSTVSGEQFTDVVSIAGLEASSQALGAATQYSGFEIDRFPADGLMGMAFESLSVYKANPVFQTLVAEGSVDSPTFGFKLASSGSELFVGGTNSELYKGDFTWVSVAQPAYWQAPFDKITVGGYPVPVVGKTETIFDTGTTLIVGDMVGIQQLYAALVPFGAMPATPQDGVGLYTIPCNFKTTISVYVGGKEVKISPETFNLGAASEAGRCIAGAAWSPALTGEFWILGDVFLRNTYTAWDVENKRIGFADLA